MDFGGFSIVFDIFLYHSNNLFFFENSYIFINKKKMKKKRL